MDTCGSFCLKTNLFWVTPMSVFGYKTIHNFHCLWYNNSIWYMPVHVYEPVSHCTRQVTVDFISMYSLGQCHPPYCLYVAAQDRPEQGEGRKWGSGIDGVREHKHGRCKRWLVVGERTEEDVVEWEAPGRAEELGRVSGGGDQTWGAARKDKLLLGLCLASSARARKQGR